MAPFGSLDGLAGVRKLAGTARMGRQVRGRIARDYGQKTLDCAQWILNFELGGQDFA